jgi:hypothetical protein
MQTTKKRLATALLACAIGALLVDRLALYVWQLQVIRLFRSMREVVNRDAAKSPPSPFGYVASGLEPLLVMPRSPNSPIRYLTVATDIALAKPSTITLDGAGGVHLRFLPPPIAWTTWLIPRRDPGEHADPVSLDSRLAYQYKIDIEPSGTSDQVYVMLARGPHHFYAQTLPESTRPLLFP